MFYVMNIPQDDPPMHTPKRDITTNFTTHFPSRQTFSHYLTSCSFESFAPLGNFSSERTRYFYIGY